MKQFSLQARLIAGFLGSLLVLLLVGAMMHRTIADYRNNLDWVNHTHEVIETLNGVTNGLQTIVSGQRIYLLTGNEVFLAERANLEADVQRYLDRLKQLTAYNPSQAATLERLGRLVRRTLLLIDQNQQIFRTQGLEAVRNYVSSGASAQVLEDSTQLVDDMISSERNLLAERSDKVERSAQRALGIGALLVALAVAIMLLLTWRIRREMQRRLAEEASRRANELQTRQILELLPVGVLVADASGQVNQINPAAQRIWVGEHHVGLQDYGEYVGWWPDSGKRLAAQDWALARTLRSGETIRDELVDIGCFDGTRKTITNHTMPLRDEAGRITGAVAVNVDVTAFKQTERQLRAAAMYDDTQGKALALFSASFERARVFDGLLALLAAQHPFPVSALYAFDEWRGSFQCEAAHALGREVPRAFALGEGLLGQAAQSGQLTVLDSAQLTLQTGVADFVPAQVLMLPVQHLGQCLAVLVLAASQPVQEADRAFLQRLAAQLGVALHNLRQFDDLKLMAEQLRASSEEIEIKNQRLQESSRMKSEFLANMSHELRTPLNAIIGFSEVLKDGLSGELNADQKEFVNDIFASGNHLLALINDILDLSKVEAGKMTLELEALEVEPLVQASLLVVKEKAMAHRLKLSAEVAPGLGEILADERKLKQIIYNLLSNAVKFTPDGGSVRLTARRVARAAVSGDGLASDLELAVSDTGIGISAADQRRLFQPFMQIDSSLARRHEGTGLGLAMVKRLAELHGGTVTLHSTPGQGSTFTVLLPWRKQTDQVAPASTSPAPTGATLRPAAPAGAAGAPLVLVIEDDDKAAELLRLQLEGAGFRIVRAVSAEAALELARQERPDLITLDILLPGMDGWEFLERFKQQPLFSNVPVVMVSIVADSNRGLSLGASQVLQKPVRREDMMRALEAIGFATPGAAQRTVLVVDDDPKAVQLLGTQLDAAGYRVLSAFGGKEGIETARKQLPDLIVLDLMMPEVNGFEVVEALKDEARTASIPVVVVTAKQITHEDRVRLNGNVLKVLEKSEFNHGRFLSEVRRAMSSGRS